MEAKVDVLSKWKWRLITTFITENNEVWVSVSLRVQQRYDEKDKDEKIRFQLYVISKRQDKKYCREDSMSVHKLRDCIHSFGWKKIGNGMAIRVDHDALRQTLILPVDIVLIVGGKKLTAKFSSRQNKIAVLSSFPDHVRQI